MSKLVLIVLPVFMLLTSNEAIASDKEVAQNNHEYKLDTYGHYPAYVYEFTPKENDDIRCVFILNINYKSSGLSCYEVGK